MLGSTLFPWLAAWESTEKSLPDKKNGKHMPSKLWWQKKNYQLYNQLIQNT
jgi:hypothetical protein